MQPDDLAYVVCTLRFPEGVDPAAAAATAAAWPADSLGFNHLVPPPADVPDPLDRLAEAAGQQQQTQNANTSDREPQQQQQEQVDGEGERAGGGLSGCDDLTAEAAAEAVEPAESQHNSTQPPRYHRQQQQQLMRPATTADSTVPTGSAAATAAATTSLSTALSLGRPTSTSSLSNNSSAPPSTHSFSPEQSLLYDIPPDSPFLVVNDSCDIYTPAGSASSGTLGPGISAVRQGASAHENQSTHMLVKTPGVTTTMIKAVPAVQGTCLPTPGGAGPGITRENPQGHRGRHDSDMTLDH